MAICLSCESHVRWSTTGDRMNGWEYVLNLSLLFDPYAALLRQRGDTEARPFVARAETIRKNVAGADEQMRRFQQWP